MKNESKSRLSRRNFLLAVGAGGAATAAAIASRAIATDEPGNIYFAVHTYGANDLDAYDVFVAKIEVAPRAGAVQ